jgi:hypothetical protein
MAPNTYLGASLPSPALTTSALATLSGNGSPLSTHSGRRSRMMKKTPISPPTSRIATDCQ